MDQAVPPAWCGLALVVETFNARLRGADPGALFAAHLVCVVINLAAV